jgi:hypothetical protein
MLGNTNWCGCLDLLYHELLLGYSFDHLLAFALSCFYDYCLWFLDNHHLLMNHFERFCYRNRIWFLKKQCLFFRYNKGLLLNKMWFIDIKIMINRYFFDITSINNMLFLYLNNMKLRLF